MEALCLLTAMHDPSIRNVPGVSGPNDPDPEWNEAGIVITRAQVKKIPLKVSEQASST